MSKFTNFEGDNLDNYLGHELIEIKENYVKSKIIVKDITNNQWVLFMEGYIQH